VCILPVFTTSSEPLEFNKAKDVTCKIGVRFPIEARNFLFLKSADTGRKTIHLSAQYISYRTGMWNRQRLSICLEVQNVSISKQINCNNKPSCRWYHKSAVPSIIPNDYSPWATALRRSWLMQKSVLIVLLRLSVACRPYSSMNMRLNWLDDLCPMSHKTN
jgi:hypothetical protein